MEVAVAGSNSPKRKKNSMEGMKDPSPPKATLPTVNKQAMNGNLPVSSLSMLSLGGGPGGQGQYVVKN